MAKLTIFI